MEKKTLHVIPHSHWDREWYMSFEQHRMRLVELFDSLIDTMEKYPEYTYYHMDGQYIVIEDYLEIRPQMKERLLKLIHAGRIRVGPWYVLQDEYLTDGEANVRNMLYGIRLCKELGAEPEMVGYFPDAFGNVSQAPQILQGFGIDNAAFGRGVGQILADNQATDERLGRPSELIWRAPDGSEVLGVMFIPWYHNAMELPRDPEKLKARMDKLMAPLQRSAATPHMLGLNGCDHQPVQTDLHEVLRTAQELYGEEWEIKQSNFTELIEALRPYRDRFITWEGEINGQRTAGACPLICTASAHVKLKQKNHRGQNILERIAEPLSVMALLQDGKDYRDELFYAWKKLMQNHPHDSICCCSCDEVTREMDTRFEKSYEAARFVQEECMDRLTAAMDTAAFGERCITVFHTAPGYTKGTVTAYVDYPEDAEVDALYVTKDDGTAVPSVCKKLGRTFTYTLPKDRFRQPKYVQRFEVTLLVEAEGIGYTTYGVVAGKKELPCVAAEPRSIENELLALRVEADGTVTLQDKRSGELYRNNLIYEDSGDRGNLYNYVETEGERIYAAAGAVSCRVAAQNPCFATLELTAELAIPAGLQGNGRTAETLAHTVKTYLTLTAGVPRVDVKTVVNNQSENHRLRALFVPEIQAERVQAEGQFDVVDREIVPDPVWKNPCYCQRIQTFFSLFNGERGLAVAVRGLNEYEILRDGKNTMALTLLRGVDQVGDWGYFPTPDGQCKGEHTLCYSLIPFGAEGQEEAYREAFAFHGDPLIARGHEAHEGSLAAAGGYLTLQGDAFSFAAFKAAEGRDTAILRFYNTSCCAQEGKLLLHRPVKGVWLTNLAEERLQPLAVENGAVSLTAGAKKIVTVEIEF